MSFLYLFISNVEKVEPPQTMYEVKNLEHNAIYQFRIYAVNQAGQSLGLLLRTCVRIREDIREYSFISKIIADFYFIKVKS